MQIDLPKFDIKLLNNYDSDIYKPLYKASVYSVNNNDSIKIDNRIKTLNEFSEFIRTRDIDKYGDPYFNLAYFRYWIEIYERELRHEQLCDERDNNNVIVTEYMDDSETNMFYVINHKNVEFDVDTIVEIEEYCLKNNINYIEWRSDNPPPSLRIKTGWGSL